MITIYYDHTLLTLWYVPSYSLSACPRYSIYGFKSYSTVDINGYLEIWVLGQPVEFSKLIHSLLKLSRIPMWHCL